VGYAGGRQPDPTYRQMGDHSETIQIDFDPSRVDYKELLALFWQSHNPTASRPRQYRSVIFYHDATQRRAAEASRDSEKLRRQEPLVTEILPLDAFYRAEDYHQKYYLRRETDLLQELQRFYPASRDLIDASSAARINGYIVGFGSAATLANQADQLGLSPEGHRRLRELFEWRRP
jgi:methionine-S-sulfoxide reductase